ncbi:MAG: discoidin domain-containing protein [Lentisphaeria bacterium]
MKTRNQAIFFQVALLLLTGVTALASELNALRTPAALDIDGKLAEAAWQQVAVCSEFTGNKTAEKAQVRTEASFLYDDQAIYIGVKAFMPPGSKYQINDNNLYAGECVEVMLDPGATRNVYFHFITNPNAEKFDGFRDQGGFVGDPKWDALWQVATHQTPEFWSCEFRIPLSSLDIPAGSGARWAVNIARGARGLPPGEAMEDSAMAADGAYHIAGKFPLLTGFDNDFSQFAGWSSSKPVLSTAAADEPGIIALQCAVNFSNRDATARKASVVVDLFAPDNEEAQSKSITLELPAGGDETVVFDGFTFKKTGEYRCDVLLCDPISKRILQHRQYTLPVDFQPIRIQLLDPHYKNAVFATMKLDKIRYRVQVALSGKDLVNKKLRTGIRDTNGKILFETTTEPVAESEFTFPTADLPEAKMSLFALLNDTNGNRSAEVTEPLRKLPYLSGEIFLAKDGTLIRDGKPFFPIMQWAASEDFIEGVNVFLDWKPFRNTYYMSPVLSHNKEMGQLRHSPTINSSDAEKIQKVILDEMHKPGLFAYYLSDEPEVFGDTVNALNHFYKVISDTDPWHPVIISNDTISGIADYANTADLNGAHAYPAPAREKAFNNFEKITNFLDAFNAFFKGRPHFQSLAWLAQGFDYSNYAAVKTRVPRYLELRNQHLITFIAGGRGVILYNRFNEHYPEIGIGLVEHVKELQAYAPALLEPDPGVTLKIDGEGFRAIARKHRGYWWIFAANLQRGGEREMRLTLPPLGNAALRVLTEDRTVTTIDGVLRDQFTEFAVHVYTADPNYPQLRSGSDIEAEIAQRNAARKKPGNLAFQMFEHENVQVAASSNQALNVRADNCLWHVADGVIQPPDFKHYYSQQLVWTDATPNQSPDWIEVTFKKPVSVGRVVVYPIDNSLKSYQVQIRNKGEYQTAAELSDASGVAQEHQFAPQTAEAVRIYITGTRGANAKITEIEIYEK